MTVALRSAWRFRTSLQWCPCEAPHAKETWPSDS